MKNVALTANISGHAKRNDIHKNQIVTHHLSNFIKDSGLELFACAFAFNASSYFVKTNSNWALVPSSKKTQVLEVAIIKFLEKKTQ